MLKWIAAFCGYTVLSVSVICSIFLYRQYVKAENQDKVVVTAFATQSEGLNCEIDNLPEFFETSLSKRVLSENESLIFTVHLRREETEECNLEISLNAPDFEARPREESITITMQINQKAKDLLWVLSPKKSGEFPVVAELHGTYIAKSVVVTNVLGFTVVQAQVLSYLGFFLGPGLTLPWWYERWKARKQRAPKKRSKRKR